MEQVNNHELIVIKRLNMPSELPKVTHMFLKCLDYKFAKAFMERGGMRFALSSEWEPDGTSRGDNLEGVYASQKGFDPTLDLLLKLLRKDSFSFEDGEWLFYKSKEILEFRSYCLYGINSNELSQQKFRSQDHRYHYGGKVAKDYFHNLYPNIKEDEYDALDSDKRPAVIFIRPYAFVKFVTTKLQERGVLAKEIHISPISYSDYYMEPLRIVKAPDELFSKHISFSEQKEVRIVIDTRRTEVNNLFDENGVIELGPVDKSIASISQYYFKDMSVEIRGNQLLYELPREEVYELADVGEAYISLLYQTLCDELPKSPMSIDLIESEIEKCMSVIQGVDPNASYDKTNNILYYKGSKIDIGKEAIIKMLDHYNNYILEGDMIGAGETIDKFKHFFPKIDMGDYFSSYFKQKGEKQ